jgi:hypothetical protein
MLVSSVSLSETIIAGRPRTAIVELMARGSLPNDGKVIADERLGVLSPSLTKLTQPIIPNLLRSP